MAGRLIIVVLLFAMFSQTFSKAMLVTSYYANTSAYAKNCVNKARPAMHCNGRCQLMKKMKQEENGDRQSPAPKNGFDEVLSSKTFFTSVVSLPGFRLKHNPFYIPYSTKKRSREYFQPPQA
jgi:hypothetical protein